MLNHAANSKFVITAGTGSLKRTDLTKSGPGETTFGGGGTKVETGSTSALVAPVDGHKVLVAQSPDSPGAPPIQVQIDPKLTSEDGADPAKVLAHEIGGHATDVIDAASSNSNQYVDGVNMKDETSSKAAENSLGGLPSTPSADDVNAVNQMLSPTPAPQNTPPPQTSSQQTQ
jgi:hypothetical protein